MTKPAAVAHVLIQPKAFKREMSPQELEVVDDLIRSFHERMNGLPLVVAIQAIAVLTADYCGQVSARGGESICVLQDIAARGEEWLSAGDAAKAVVAKAGVRRKRKVG